MAVLNDDELKEPIRVYSNGERIIFENKPFIKETLVYFPLRETFEQLGVFEIEGNEIVWDNGTIYIKVAEDAEKEHTLYTIKIGNDSIDIEHLKDLRITNAKPLVNVKLQMPEETPLLIGDTTYVPHTYIEYMLNRGLGIRNRSNPFDFMFIVNSEPPSAFISQGFVMPCDGEILNEYGKRREHPITKEIREHNGVDIIADVGTDVNSAITGVVTETGFDNEKGNYIIIEQGNIKTVYTHLTEEMTVSEGDEVSRGQIIGKVGNNGTSAGGLVHFEVLINGKYFNPEFIS